MIFVYKEIELRFVNRKHRLCIELKERKAHELLIHSIFAPTSTSSIDGMEWLVSHFNGIQNTIVLSTRTSIVWSVFLLKKIAPKD